MLDPHVRQALADRLRGKVKKASSCVTTKVEAEKGDFRVVLAADTITQYYKGQEVGKIRVAELDDEVVAFINEDPNQAAEEALHELTASFDPSALKTAGHETQSDETYQKVTQKQLEDQKTKLHPRTDEYPTKVTQKQLPEAGLRPGTYEYTTEAQLREERKTFYGKERTSGDWRNEDRNIVVERQLDKGAKEYSDIGQSDRGQIGAEYDGGLEQQHRQIGEKQIMELLKHHEWSEPLTTTEGKDQLAGQEGELSRVTASVAEKIVKEALQSLGKTVLAAGATPNRLAGIVRRLVSHESKLAPLADTMRRLKETDITPINNRVAKARAFGKTANTSTDWSDSLVADILISQLSKSAYSPRLVVDGLTALAESSDLEARIEKACEECLSCQEEPKQANTNVNIFKTVLSGEHKKDRTIGSASDDGLYMYTGNVNEIKADVADQNAFSKAAAAYALPKAKQHAPKTADLVPQSIDVDNGEFNIIFLDLNHQSATLQARAARRRQMVKEAQMGGPAGGMPPMGGAEMQNPAPPPGGADMGAAPAGEALSQEPPPPAPAGEEGAGEPKPPGTTCNVCGSNDVDLDSGDWHCNNCGSEGHIKIINETTKWVGTLENKEEDGADEGFGLGAEDEAISAIGNEGGGLGGEGSGSTMPNVPVGASVRVRDILNKYASKRMPKFASVFRITPLLVEKMAEEKIRPGSVCPNCGGHNTDLVKSASRRGEDGICWTCNQEYNFQVRAKKDRKNAVAGIYIWRPKTAESECKSCNRLKSAFLKSLANYGTTWERFASLRSMKEQGDLILKMAKAGSLELSDALKAPLPIKTASKNNFPYATCKERLSRRFGENATAMSGPCQGKKLADCVCGQLQQAGVYTDGLAAKVASAQFSDDPMIHSPMRKCVSMFLKADYEFEDACTACEGIRAAYADTEDLIVEAIAQLTPMSAPGNVVDPAASPQPKAKMPAPVSANPAAPAPMKPMSAPSKPMEGGIADEIGDPMDDVVLDGGDTDIGGDMGGDFGGDDFGGLGGNDFGGDSAFSIEMEGDLGDEGLSLDDDGLGIGDEVTIKLPQEAMDALQVLMDALQGQLGGDMMEPVDAGEDMLDVSDVNGPVDDAGGLGNEVSEIGDGDGDEDPDGGPDGVGAPTEEGVDEEEDIPGLVEDESQDGLVKDSEPAEDKPCNKPKDCGAPAAKPAPQPTRAPEGENPKEKPMEQQASAQELENLLYRMKTGTFQRRSDAIGSVFDGLLHQAEMARQAKEEGVKKLEYKGADEGSKLTAKPAQDTDGIGKVQDGGKIGHEEKFSADDPNVPRGDALIGDEGSDMKVNDKEYPKVPVGSKAMEGESAYKPEKGNQVDGNQGGKKASVWTVGKDHKYFGVLSKRAASGHKTVKLADGLDYALTSDQNGNFVLIAQNSSRIMQEAQTVTPKKVDSLADDPDINQTSGPGEGKVQEDKPHSLAVDEKKPSEGMSEPSVPDAPNDGRLSREHTVEKAKDAPNIPAGGGSNSEYDQNEKNDPEKLDQALGKQNDIAAMASISHDEAVKIASQMAKANLIPLDQIPDQVRMLTQATPEIAQNYINLLKSAQTTKGMTKVASSDAVETPFLLKSASGLTAEQSDLKDKVKGLFRLDQRNRDYERYSQEKETKLWR